MSKIVALALGLLLMAGCASPSARSQVTIVRPTPTAMATGASPTAAPTVAKPTPALATATPSAQSLLEKGTKPLLDRPYKFKISADYAWSYQGEKQDWQFTGEGAADSSRFTSKMEGPADSMWSIVIIDGKVEAWDNKGKILNATIATGGPGPGTAPYTVIAYLKKFQQPAIVSSEGDKAQISFQPDLASLSLQDPANAEAISKVRKVQGQAWVSKASGNIDRETVTIDFTAKSGAEETVTMTLEFYDYGIPVSIE